MEGEKDPVSEKVDPLAPQMNKHFRYALDLFNHGYFWESHVYFEAIWNAHGRKGTTAEFMKGMIKLGAAAIKFKLDQTVSGEGHLARGMELFDYVKKEEGSPFLGMDLDAINASILEAMEKKKVDFNVYPLWK